MDDDTARARAMLARRRTRFRARDAVGPMPCRPLCICAPRPARTPMSARRIIRRLAARLPPEPRLGASRDFPFHPRSDRRSRVHSSQSSRHVRKAAKGRRLRLFARPCSCRRPISRCAPACRRRSRRSLERWEDMDLYERLRESAAGPRRNSCCTTARPTPTATSISATRSTRSSRTSSPARIQMRGYDSNYVPGWDCHGLPIEWKIEETVPRQGQEQGRGAGQSSSARNAAPSPQHWIDVQREEFKRLGVDRRLGESLHDHGLPRRSADRRAS